LEFLALETPCLHIRAASVIASAVERRTANRTGVSLAF
jgi:hypothetical protein